MTTSFRDSNGDVNIPPALAQTGLFGRLGVTCARLGTRNRWRILIGLTAYTLWSLLLVRSIFIGQSSRAVLLVLPLILLAANRFPRVALLVAIPSATFGVVVLSSWLSLRAYGLIVAIAGLGVLTRRWRLLAVFHGTVLLLATMVIASAFTNEATVGGNSVRSLSLYTAMNLLMMASAAVIKPRVDHVLLVIAFTGSMVSWTVIAGWFRMTELTQTGPLLRVYALGLNPNSLGLIISLGVVAAFGIAIERRTAWFVILAVPGLLALPDLKSRTALVVIVAGLAWLAIAAPGRRALRLFVITSVLLFVWLFRPSIVGDIYRFVLGARAEVDLSESTEIRAGVARFALEVGVDNWLIGVGFGQFPSVADGRFALATPSAHNEYLRYFAELGVVGLGLLIAVIVQVILAVWLFRRNSATAGAVLAVFAAAMLTIEPLHNLPTSMGVSVLAGSVVGAGLLRSNKYGNLTRTDAVSRFSEVI